MMKMRIIVFLLNFRITTPVCSSHRDIAESAVIALSNLRVAIQRKEVLLVLVMRSENGGFFLRKINRNLSRQNLMLPCLETSPIPDLRKSPFL